MPQRTGTKEESNNLPSYGSFVSICYLYSLGFLPTGETPALYEHVIRGFCLRVSLVDKKYATTFSIVLQS